MYKVVDRGFQRAASHSCMMKNKLQTHQIRGGLGLCTVNTRVSLNEQIPVSSPISKKKACISSRGPGIEERMLKIDHTKYMYYS